MVEQTSIFITENKHRLHLRRICKDKSGPPIFMMHGAIENGRIFYTESNKGLAPYLAEHGFDVFVADMRGRGESTPAISKHAEFGQFDTITKDMPKFVQKIVDIKGHAPQTWVGHSWGGVLMIAYLLRELPYSDLVTSQINFGSKRFIGVKNVERLLKIELIWKRIGPLLCWLYGYFPARQFKFGSDNETRLSLRESIDWVTAKHWQDKEDNFDYRQAAKTIILPPTLHIAGSRDHCLGSPCDVRRLIGETRYQDKSFLLIGRENGFQKDYDHIDMLTAPTAREDHFPHVKEWCLKYLRSEHYAELSSTC